MKLDYLDDVTDGGKYPWADPDKLLRLYDFDYNELKRLKQAIQENLINRAGTLSISSLDFVEPINCYLTFQLSHDNSGIKFPPDHNNNFLGLFSRVAYINMLDIIDGLVEKDNDVSGFNWLYDAPDADRIDLLLSCGIGSW
jgi:hypothetical protein